MGGPTERRRILDAYSGLEGYHILFWMALAFGLCGPLIAGVVMVRINHTALHCESPRGNRLKTPRRRKRAVSGGAAL